MYCGAPVCRRVFFTVDAPRPERVGRRQLTRPLRQVASLFVPSDALMIDESLKARFNGPDLFQWHRRAAPQGLGHLLILFVVIIVSFGILRQSLGHRERFLHGLDDVLIVGIEQIAENACGLVRANGRPRVNRRKEQRLASRL